MKKMFRKSNFFLVQKIKLFFWFRKPNSFFFGQKSKLCFCSAEDWSLRGQTREGFGLRLAEADGRRRSMQPREPQEDVAPGVGSYMSQFLGIFDNFLRKKLAFF
jgi:hypothetical protein